MPALSQTIDIIAFYMLPDSLHIRASFKWQHSIHIPLARPKNIFFTTIDMTLRKKFTAFFIWQSSENLLLFTTVMVLLSVKMILSRINIVYLVNVYQKIYCIYLGRISENYPKVHKNTMKMLSTRWI